MVGIKGRSGIYERTNEHKKNISKSFNKKCLNNLIKYKEGHIPWHKGTKGIFKGGFKKGCKGYWNGKKLSKRHRREISEKTKEAMKSPLIREKISKAGKGKHNSPKTEFKRGKDHPNWKGRTKEDILRVGWSSWKKIRQVILKRDTICLGCGKKDGKLNVHHIDKNWKNNNLDNLILLCNKCHGKVHSKNPVRKEKLLQRISWQITRLK